MYNYVRFYVPQNERHPEHTLAVQRLSQWRDNTELIDSTRCRLERQNECWVEVTTATQEEWDEYIDPQLRKLEYLLGRPQS